MTEVDHEAASKMDDRRLSMVHFTTQIIIMYVYDHTSSWVGREGFLSKMKDVAFRISVRNFEVTPIMFTILVYVHLCNVDHGCSWNFLHSGGSLPMNIIVEKHATPCILTERKACWLGCASTLMKLALCTSPRFEFQTARVKLCLRHCSKDR